MGVGAGRVCIAAAVAVFPGLLSPAAAAQSLALSYNLELGRAAFYYGGQSLDRCAALIEAGAPPYACRLASLMSMPTAIPELLQGTAVKPGAMSAGERQKEGDASVPPETNDAAVVTIEPKTFSAELPLLGSAPPKPSIVRVLGGREALGASLKTVDLMLRLGSKYRLKSAEDGWEVYKFTDSPYESRFQNTIKAIAVELLIPFQ